MSKYTNVPQSASRVQISFSLFLTWTVVVVHDFSFIIYVVSAVTNKKLSFGFPTIYIFALYYKRSPLT